MFTIHRTRLDLLPFYGRFAATLYPYVPDVALELVQLLKHDFKYHVKKKVCMMHFYFQKFMHELFFWKKGRTVKCFKIRKC